VQLSTPRAASTNKDLSPTNTTQRDEYPHAAIVHFNLAAAMLATGDAEAAARHIKRV